MTQWVQDAFVWPEDEASEVSSYAGRRCRWTTLWDSQCARLGTDELCGVPLCGQHQRSAEAFITRHLTGHPAMIADLYWRVVFEPRFGELPDPGRSVVYFVERQGFVKIGTSTNLGQRLRDIGKGGQMVIGMTVGPVRLLATTPGDQRHEKFLHDRFRPLRIEGEWFMPDTELCEFIRRLPNVNLDLLGEVEIRHGIAEEDEVADEAG